MMTGQRVSSCLIKSTRMRTIARNQAVTKEQRCSLDLKGTLSISTRCKSKARQREDSNGLCMTCCGTPETRARSDAPYGHACLGVSTTFVCEAELHENVWRNGLEIFAN